MICKTDFEIWDRVLERRPGWYLESQSALADHADYQLMLEAQRERGRCVIVRDAFRGNRPWWPGMLPARALVRGGAVQWGPTEDFA